MLSYKGNKIADKGYLINLPYRVDRKEKTLKLLSELGFEGYEIVDGVVFDDPEWKIYGCTQAYLNCFKTALENNWDSVVIFEDDIKVMNRTKISDIDAIFSKWGFFSNYFDLIGLGTRPIEGSKIFRIDEHFGKVTNTLCTQAFFYKKNFIEYFYNNMKNYTVPDDPYYRVIVDEFFSDCCSHEIVCKKRNKLFNVGITIPMIFTQRDGYSDNLKSYEKFDEYLDKCYWNALKLGDEITNKVVKSITKKT